MSLKYTIELLDVNQYFTDSRQSPWGGAAEPAARRSLALSIRATLPAICHCLEAGAAGHGWISKPLFRIASTAAIAA